MSRTTVDIDQPVLDEVKRLAGSEGKSLGAAVSELLLEALDRRKRRSERPEPFRWISKPMGARVELSDKEAVYEILDDLDAPVVSLVAEEVTPYGEPEGPDEVDR
jgi:hypothetical protein